MFLTRTTVVKVYKFGWYGEVSYYTGKSSDTTEFLLSSEVYAVMALDNGVLGIGVELRGEDEQ